MTLILFINSYNGTFLIEVIFAILLSIIYISLSQDKSGQTTLIAAREISFAIFIFTIVLLFWFDKSTIGFQFHEEVNIINGYDIFLSIGVDGISLCFILLTAFIMPLCFIAAASITKFKGEFAIYLLIIEFLLLLTFLSTDLIFFFVFFESVLIPMFIIIGIYGARPRKIRAAYIFFLYTLFGSFFMLYGIFYLNTIVTSTNFSTLLYMYLTKDEQIFLWICFFIPFAIKIPMVPFHIWLPEAHVEAPTIGSVILASLLLKLGGYGFIRFVLPMFPFGTYYFLPLLQILGVISILYASLSTIRQSDIKRIIAYSSIAHMNLIVLGLFSCTFYGIDGAIYLMIGHGIVSSGLFFCVGVLYDRYHTRLIRHYGGIGQLMPIFGIFFFLFTLANMSFPGTSNFIGEFLIFTGLFKSNPWVTLLAATGIVWSAIYSIWLFNRVVFGSLNIGEINKNIQLRDLNRNESLIFVSLAIVMLALGLNSSFITCLTNYPIQEIEHIIINKL